MPDAGSDRWPVLVEVSRGGLVESKHRGAIAVIGDGGKIHAQVGDVSFTTITRSTAKPIQALLTISSGAAKRFKLAPSELAIISGSHSGEVIHVEQVRSILKKIGLDESSLQCGSHHLSGWIPTLESDKGEDILKNNCSGKHAGMLAQSVAGALDVKTYTQTDHPVQQGILDILSVLSETPRDDIHLAWDNCGTPVFGLPLERLALAYRNLVNPSDLPSTLRNSCARLVKAILDHPEMIGGTSNRVTTEIMRACAKSVIAKDGAEGVHAMGILPCAKYGRGLGVAFKIEDGGERAVGAVAVAVLDQLGLLSPYQRSRLARFLYVSIKDFRGFEVGQLRPVFQLIVSSSGIPSSHKQAT